MAKFAVPGTMVLGASKDIDKETFQQRTDKKGRPIWNMPKSVEQHETQQIVKVLDKSDPNHPRIRREKQTVMVPVYRGIPASLARYYRAQWRRSQRKMSLMQKITQDPGGLVQSILNPLGDKT